MLLSVKYWGESLWRIMYAVACDYPKEADQDDCERIKGFYISLSDVIPCEECRQHYTNYLIENSIDIAGEGRDSLLQWVNILENQIATKLGRQGRTLTDRLREIETVSSSPTTQTQPLSRNRTVSYGMRRPRNKDFKPKCSKCQPSQ